MQKNKTVKKSETNFHGSVALMFFGILFGIFTFVFIGMATFVSKIFLSKILAFFCFAGLLLPMKFYKNWFSLSKIEAVLFNVLAVGPVICSVLLWLNFLIRTGESEQTFNIVSSKITSAENFDNIDVVFTLENNAYEEYPEFRTVPLEKGDLQKAKAQKLKIKMADGLLGYKVFLGNDVIQE